MTIRAIAGALVVVMCPLASCASTSEFDESATEVVATEDDAVPQWIRDGVELARRSSVDPDGYGSDTGTRPATAVPTSASRTGLPDRDSVVGALVASGVPEEQATCIYNGLATNADVASDAAAILGGLAGLGSTSASGGGGATPGATASSLATLASLEPESSTRILVAIAPCLDPSTLSALLVGGRPAGGIGAGAGPMSLDALLANLTPEQLSMLQELDPAAVAATVGGALSAGELKQLQDALAQVQALGAGGQGALGTLAQLNGLDLSKLDLSALPADQLPLLLYAIIAGLNAEQQRQLQTVAGFNFDKLDLNIDPEKLTPEQIGTLLLILGPALAASISPRGGTPPPGVDPSQVYIPPGIDLSLINPLVFLNRDDAIAEFVRQGLSATAGACFIDSYARLPPATLLAFFSSDPNPVAISQFLLTSLNCLL